MTFSNRASFYLDIPLNLQAELDQFFKTQKLRANSKEYTFLTYQKKLNNFQNLINEEKRKRAQRRREEMVT